MATIIDYKCKARDEINLDESKLKEHGIKYPDVHTDHIQMRNLSLLIKEEEGNPLCKLPFCHTMEGQALGAIINFGDNKNGPRGGEYLYSNIDELKELISIDFNKGRIEQVFKACSDLKNQGQIVMLSVSGPFTILNLLIEARYVFRGFKKEPEFMYKILEKIKTEIISMVTRAKNHGVDIISYGDSIGGLNILGPKLLREVTEKFTYPLLKDLEKIADEKLIIHLCPKTVFALIGTEKAVFEDKKLSITNNKEITYYDGIVQSIGQIKFVGETCIKNSEHILERGNIKSIILI